MGLVAGDRLSDPRKVGPFLLAFGILMPLVNGFLGAYCGHLAGPNLGGCTVFAAIVASASYIAAPPAVAEKILTHVSHDYFEHYACIVWLSDVQGVRGEQYVAKRT